MRTMINLLPRAYRKQQIVRKRAVQWCSIICVVLLTSWAWHWNERRDDAALSQQLEVLARELAPTQAMLRQLVKMRSQLKELEQQELVARELENRRNALVLLGVVSQTAQRTNGRLRVTKLDLTGFQSASAPAGASAGGGQAGSLVLSGVSLDNPAVAEMLDGLQDSGIFSRVELLTLKEREDLQVSVRDYEVRCEF